VRPGRFVGLLADVSLYADCERTLRQAVSEFGGVDVLLNNAARGPLEANDNYFQAKPRFWEAPPEAWQRMIETNLIGAFYMARAVTPAMLANKFGRIVNISTSLPTMVMQGLAAYGSAKAGLEVASIVWARDLQGTGVTANVLLPGGPADTALIPGGIVGTRAKADFQQGKGMRGDEGRVGGILPAEVMVAPTLWLSADESSSCNGRRLVAKDWDPDVDPMMAADGCMQPQHNAPRIM
jgi:3-oxoacyl-[acyl-carrier protein] reductase